MRKEVKTVNYYKPELVVVPRADKAIQSGIMKGPVYRDSVELNHPFNATTPAYEADE